MCRADGAHLPTALAVTVGVLIALGGLGVGLQAVAGLMQQSRHRVV